MPLRSIAALVILGLFFGSAAGELGIKDIADDCIDLVAKAISSGDKEAYESALHDCASGLSKLPDAKPLYVVGVNGDGLQAGRIDNYEGSLYTVSPNPYWNLYGSFPHAKSDFSGSCRSSLEVPPKTSVMWKHVPVPAGYRQIHLEETCYKPTTVYGMHVHPAECIDLPDCNLRPVEYKSGHNIYHTISPPVIASVEDQPLNDKNLECDSGSEECKSSHNYYTVPLAVVGSPEEVMSKVKDHATWLKERVDDLLLRFNKTPDSKSLIAFTILCLAISAQCLMAYVDNVRRNAAIYYTVEGDVCQPNGISYRAVVALTGLLAMCATWISYPHISKLVGYFRKSRIYTPAPTQLPDDDYIEDSYEDQEPISNAICEVTSCDRVSTCSAPVIMQTTERSISPIRAVVRYDQPSTSSASLTTQVTKQLVATSVYPNKQEVREQAVDLTHRICSMSLRNKRRHVCQSKHPLVGSLHRLNEINKVPEFDNVACSWISSKCKCKTSYVVDKGDKRSARWTNHDVLEINSSILGGRRFGYYLIKDGRKKRKLFLVSSVDSPPVVECGGKFSMFLGDDSAVYDLQAGSRIGLEDITE